MLGFLGGILGGIWYDHRKAFAPAARKNRKKSMLVNYFRSISNVVKRRRKAETMKSDEYGWMEREKESVNN